MFWYMVLINNCVSRIVDKLITIIKGNILNFLLGSNGSILLQAIASRNY